MFSSLHIQGEANDCGGNRLKEILLLKLHQEILSLSYQTNVDFVTIAMNFASLAANERQSYIISK